MNKDKPAHLKEYDRRMFEGQNLMSLGNVFYKKNEDIPAKDMRDQVVQSTSPYQSPEKNQGIMTKYDIVVDRPTEETPEDSSKNSRRQVLSKHAPNQPGIQIEYHGELYIPDI